MRVDGKEWNRWLILQLQREKDGPRKGWRGRIGGKEKKREIYRGWREDKREDWRMSAKERAFRKVGGKISVRKEWTGKGS